MAVNKIIMLQSGGTVVLSVESVNVFVLTDAERELLTKISDAVRVYERKSQAEAGNIVSLRDTLEPGV